MRRVLGVEAAGPELLWIAITTVQLLDPGESERAKEESAEWLSSRGWPVPDPTAPETAATDRKAKDAGAAVEEPEEQPPEQLADADGRPTKRAKTRPSVRPPGLLDEPDTARLERPPEQGHLAGKPAAQPTSPDQTASKRIFWRF